MFIMIVNGVIVGVIMACALIGLIGGRSLFYDFTGFVNKHGKGLLWTFAICIILGIITSSNSGNKGSSCREWGKYASSC